MRSEVTTALRRHFDYLTKDYGLRPHKTPMDAWDRKWVPSVVYANGTTGVFIQFERRDACLTITVHQLRDGEFPMRGGRVSHATGYGLNAVVFLDNPEQMLDSMYSESQSGKSLDEYVSTAATLLRKHADDLLRGDFSRAEAIRTARDQILAARETPDAGR